MDGRCPLVQPRWLGYHGSRSVICFVGSKTLEKHDWVLAEIAMAGEAAEKAGVPRVVTVLAGDEKDLPSWLADFPVVFRYRAGQLEGDRVLEFADQLRSMNRLPIETSLPPREGMIDRAMSIAASRWSRLSANASALQTLQYCIEIVFRSIVGLKSLKWEDCAADLDRDFSLLLSATRHLVNKESRSLREDVEASVLRILCDDLSLLPSFTTVGYSSRAPPTRRFDYWRRQEWSMRSTL